MRTLILAALIVVLAGCTGTQPYTKEDLHQVHSVYAMLRPTYKSFKRAYKSGDKPAILHEYALEQRGCKVVDQIDQRDTIDPNINLFQASVALDTLCNTIESAYAWWAKNHGYPYEETLVPDTPALVFQGADLDLKTMPAELKHPTHLA